MKIFLCFLVLISFSCANAGDNPSIVGFFNGTFTWKFDRALLDKLLSIEFLKIYDTADNDHSYYVHLATIFDLGFFKISGHSVIVELNDTIDMPIYYKVRSPYFDYGTNYISKETRENFTEFEININAIYQKNSFIKKPSKAISSQCEDMDDIRKMMTFDKNNTKVVIKSSSKNVTTSQKVMAGCSSVFRIFFEDGATNLTLNKYSFDTIQKMAEFCESNVIKEMGNTEGELFEIANVYQIPCLMDYLFKKSYEDVNDENAVFRLKYAKIYNKYDLEDFLLDENKALREKEENFAGTAFRWMMKVF